MILLKDKKILIRILLVFIIIAISNFFITSDIMKFIFYQIAYLIIAYDVLIRALKSICKGRIFNEFFLMSIATIGAMILGAIKTGDYLEGIFVMLFYQIGELFQDVAVNKSKKNISDLMDLKPEYANLVRDGKYIRVSPKDVKIGDIIMIGPGEKVPIDGVVVDGVSNIDVSKLTGESLPKFIHAGEEILSGSINIDGALKVKTTKIFSDSTAAKILRLVENASAKKSKSEKFITKFAKVYTPIVCISALIIALLPPLFSKFVLGMNSSWSVWLYRSLSFLVASCPCALVISIPLTFFSSIGLASKYGILIKGSKFLEALSKVKYTVFDKTGTITNGTFEIVEVVSNKYSNKQLLEYAAVVEEISSHPVAECIKKYYSKDVDLKRVKDYQEISGKGIIAKVDDKNIAVGNLKLMHHLGVDCDEINKIGTVIYIAVDNEFAGYIILSDTIKENSYKTISELKMMNIKRIIMLTGDRKDVAEDISKDLKIDEFFSELLPEDKVKKMEELLKEKNTGETLVYVGDGINDAPVLAQADVGIAMGAMGSDAAIEASDVVIMNDDPYKIIKAVKIANNCMKIVYQNIFGSIFIKILALFLIAFGLVNMWFAIFADVGVTILAVLNASRCLIFKRCDN